MISTRVFPTVKQGGGGGVECFAGDTVSDLFKIQGTLNQHLPQRYAVIRHPICLGLVGLSFVFQQDNDPTHLQAV